MPLLNYFNWGINLDKQIIRSKKLNNPLISIRSIKQNVNVFPDYLLQYKGENIFVLDAKAPNADIESGKNVEQVYYYSIHQEIKCRFFGLINGFLFTIFEQSKDKPILTINLEHITKLDIQNLEQFLGNIKEESYKIIDEDFDYLSRPLPKPIGKIKKRAKKRHYGVHPYFTKQSWDVLQNHIKAFTKPQDVVLDSFGGGDNSNRSFYIR
jgi:DNA modification methylase